MHSNANILIQNLRYTLPNGKNIFNDLSLVFSHLKTGLVGRNGTGKSTLFKLMIGELQPNSGFIQTHHKITYVPQNTKVIPQETIADVLGFSEKLNALQRIHAGSINENDYIMLNDEWDIEERLRKQLDLFHLSNYSAQDEVIHLSGGEVTRLLLTKAFHTNADILLLDEPTNHLDNFSRQILYKIISEWQKNIIVISHDRSLLQFMEQIIELSSLGATTYGGNYNDYQEQKNREVTAKEQQLADANKLINKTKRVIQLNYEKHERRQSQGRRLRRFGSQAPILLDAMKERSSRTQGESSTRHEHALQSATSKLQQAKENLEVIDDLHIDLAKTYVPNNKLILKIEDLVFNFPDSNKTIIHYFNLTLQGPERIHISGDNGSGKTTLIKLILNELKPLSGKIYLGTEYLRYIDQNSLFLNPEKSILENFILMNSNLTEHDAYQYLAQFHFKNINALKLINELSGGERLRALLACVLCAKNPPQLLILDEPTNHLDIHSIEAIESVLMNYEGAMIIISHDKNFIKHIGITKTYDL